MRGTGASAPLSAGVRGTAQPESTFAAQTSAMRSNDRFLTWVRTDPPLGGADLRPYIYFASERYALPVGLAQRLSPAGARALEGLRSSSEAAQQDAASGTTTLPLPEVTAILGELAAYARSGRVDLTERASPLAAMVEVAKRRPEVGGDVLAAILGMPFDMLPAGAAVLVNALGAVSNLRDAASKALETLAAQTRNEELRVAAEARLRAVRDAGSVRVR